MAERLRKLNQDGFFSPRPPPLPEVSDHPTEKENDAWIEAKKDGDSYKMHGPAIAARLVQG